ncbi:MAG: peptidyl-prolyl cis-trans isomerase [Betaproteobacteria bacterium]|nr:peptidyl-prolyl cis-trans isomerase [Betaproteobacteria bacterium]
MKRLLLLLLALLAFAVHGANPVVEMRTSMGTVVLELYPDKAPRTVENFLAHVRDGFYDGTVFHRVIDGFMVQGGGFDKAMKEKPTRPPVQNEAGNGLANERGTIAMARTSDPHSASAQFFINLKDNDFLNFRDSTPRGFGYCVFGKVSKGMEVVQAIARVPKTSVGMHDDVPRTPVVIEAARLLPAAGPR